MRRRLISVVALLAMLIPVAGIAQSDGGMGKKKQKTTQTHAPKKKTRTQNSGKINESRRQKDNDTPHKGKGKDEDNDKTKISKEQSQRGSYIVDVSGRVPGRNLKDCDTRIIERELSRSGVLHRGEVRVHVRINTDGKVISSHVINSKDISGNIRLRHCFEDAARRSRWSESPKEEKETSGYLSFRIMPR